jgi:hypothetical protein
MAGLPPTSQVSWLTKRKVHIKREQALTVLLTDVRVIASWDALPPTSQASWHLKQNLAQ